VLVCVCLCLCVCVWTIRYEAEAENQKKVTQDALSPLQRELSDLEDQVESIYTIVTHTHVIHMCVCVDSTAEIKGVSH
jgi:hypothetical protein